MHFIDWWLGLYYATCMYRTYAGVMARFVIHKSTHYLSASLTLATRSPAYSHPVLHSSISCQCHWETGRVNRSVHRHIQGLLSDSLISIILRTVWHVCISELISLVLFQTKICLEFLCWILLSGNKFCQHQLAKQFAFLTVV